MARRDLDFEMYHRDQPVRGARWTAVADPTSGRELTRIAENWLKANGWKDKGRWPEFNLIVRIPGEHRELTRARAA